jgi:aldehyde dehydrogenase (NAD+)
MTPPGSSTSTPIDWDYAPAPESAAIGRVRDRYQMYVGGRFVDGRGDDVKTINPGTEEALASVSTAAVADVDDAVAAARTAYEQTWSRISGAERGKYLFRIARGIAERARELAVVETLDNGKPIKESRDVDIPTASAHFFYYAGWADKLQHAGFGPSPRSLGVAGQVIPWNFPLLMAAWKIAPALAAGNTVVIKPAETTPLSILVLAEIIADADLPPGVVNIITGAGDIGAALVNHPGIDKVAFTGSTEVGKQIQSSLAGTGRKITLELGGKAANIIFDDAPVDQAVEGIVNGIFFNQGHVCCAGSRLLVQESVADEVIEKLRARVATLRLGDPMDKNTDVGAINSATQLATIRSLTDAGDAEGASRWTSPCPVPDRGFYFPPTVFTDVSQSMRIAREEIFGPVLSVLTFRTPDEAVAKANNTPYGLSAGVWTEKGSRILGMASAMRAGVVWANTFNRFDPTAAFGGYKESGFGREGGRSGLSAYLDTDDEFVGESPSAGTISAVTTSRRDDRSHRVRGTAVDTAPAGTADVSAEADTLAVAERLSEAEALADAVDVVASVEKANTADTADATTIPGPRVGVAKTYKLYIGGAFPRSESGRTYPVADSSGAFAANAAQASRKDARDAVSAARKAFRGWSGATAYNRGQVIYRIAEMLEGRRAQFIDLLGGDKDAVGASGLAAARDVDLSIDRLVQFAGWTDKIAAVFGGANPVAGPYFSFSTPEPTGVVAAIGPQDDQLLGLVSVIAPIITSGNTIVVIANRSRPLPAITLAEVLATSDLPGGVVNILTGDPAEIAPHLAAHGDVNALDLTGSSASLRTELERAAAGTVKRVYAPSRVPDFTREPGTARMRAFLETKTVWHPTGAVSLAGGSGY